jgi:hypothetical protein
MRPTLSSASYTTQLADTAAPELATSFICAGLLYEAASQFREAGLEFLHAAWVLDDHQLDSASRAWRGRAADNFLTVFKTGKAFTSEPGVSEAIAVDCLRRAGRGGEALPAIECILTANYPEVINKILLFQRHLIQVKDTRRYLVKDAIEYTPTLSRKAPDSTST